MRFPLETGLFEDCSSYLLIGPFFPCSHINKIPFQAECVELHPKLVCHEALILLTVESTVQEAVTRRTCYRVLSECW